MNVLVLSLLGCLLQCHALVHHKFVVRETPYSRLCSKKNILTVNGQFPGPTLYARKGETFIVEVHNRATENITIHWHGVNMPKYPWSDGPEYITQCPIKPGGKFRQRVILSTEEGTLWWHAHSEWSRATVHGALVVYPSVGTSYPFPKPYAEVPIILGEWWKRDIKQVFKEFIANGGDPVVSDALLINGQPGDLYPCSKSDTFKLMVDNGKTYLLRVINAAMSEIHFFSVAKHRLTVVGIDGSYTKPFETEYLAISPGQTLDVLLEANQPLNHYYMASKVYNSVQLLPFDNTTTTAIVQYNGKYTPSLPPQLPKLPYYNDINASFSFSERLKGLSTQNCEINVIKEVTTKFFVTLSINAIPCDHNKTCIGPNGEKLSASMNNISFVSPTIDILRAYYNHINGIYNDDFPDFPSLEYNYTADYLHMALWAPQKDTQVRVLDFNSTVEIVFQGTSLLGGTDHPMHLHGHSFFVVGSGFGNFDKAKDPLKYNLVDPPLQNTVVVPKNGWTSIRFIANNPGVWFMHCHLERHMNWGMDMVFITKNGIGDNRIAPPPPDLPPC